MGSRNIVCSLSAGEEGGVPPYGKVPWAAGYNRHGIITYHRVEVTRLGTHGVLGCLWRVPEEVPTAEAGLYEGLPRWVAQFLWNRGIRSPAALASYLYGKGIASDPWGFQQMEKAVQLILEAKLRGAEVLIYGDFDVDGLTAVALLVEGLARLGLSIKPHIPTRAEGYGLRMDRLEAIGGRLIIAVDCGVADGVAIDSLRRRGIQTIVVDHHQLPPELPPAAAILHPQLSSLGVPYSSVGIAFNLLRALADASGKDLGLRSLLDLVALGTLADMAALVGENRALVRYGLAVLRQNPRPGLRSLMDKAGLRQSHINSRTVAFALAPRINAPGRLSVAGPVLELLTTYDAARADHLAEWVEGHNYLRREWFSAVHRQAHPEVLRQIERGRRCVVVAGDGWPPGLMGLLAARIVEEFWVPAVALAKVDGTWRGSIRTPPGISSVGMLMAASHVLMAYGGHQGAGGLTLAEERLPELVKLLEDLAKVAEPAEPKVLSIDAHISFQELAPSLKGDLSKLEPFGEGNPEPVLLLKDVWVRTIAAVGSAGAVKLRIGSAGGPDTISASLYRNAREWRDPGEIGMAVIRARMPRGHGLDLEFLDFYPGTAAL